jgi:hypothetical protein
MTIIAPTLPTPLTSAVTNNNASPTPSAPIAAVSGTLLAAGLAVAQMAPGSMLRALVTGKNEAGQLVLDMGKVKVALATQASLPAGSEVVLQVRSSGPRMQVMVQPALPEGQGPVRHAAPQVQSPASPPAPLAAQTAAATPAVEPHVSGLTTTAVVVAGPLPDEAHAARGAPPAPPTASAPPAGTPTSPQTPTTSPLSAGTSVNLRINVVLPPGEPLPPQLAQPSTLPGQAAALQTPRASVQVGVVSAFTASGHPLVQTQAGLLLLGSKLTAPVGATVVLELEPTLAEDSEATPTPASSSAGRGASGSAPTFPRLAQALEAFRDAGVSMPAVVARHLPHTGPRLAEGLINALAAAHDEDGFQALERLLRPALERMGQREMGEALHQELARPSGSTGNATQTDWRVYTLPLFDNGQLHQLRIYERQHGGGRQQQAGGPPGSRFVVEVEMSRLGAMQLDGLVQPKRFDLMLRSRQPLPEEVRRDIAALFAEARSAAGFAGEIGFQQTPVFPVNPKAAEIHGPGVIV